jgi:hypothetical protein
MERATSDVERTHNARMPGAMKFTRGVAGVDVTWVSEKKSNSATGMPTVKSSVSPRRMFIETSARV